jgi:hypothetical protein
VERYYREVDGYYEGDKPTISLREFKVLSRTEKGAWITDLWDHDGTYKRFVLDGKGKRFAYPTKELARESYIIRKAREIGHCARQHDKAKKLLHIAQTGELPQPEYFHFDVAAPK